MYSSVNAGQSTPSSSTAAPAATSGSSKKRTAGSRAGTPVLGATERVKAESPEPELDEVG